MQKFPRHMAHFLADVYNDASLFETFRILPNLHWFDKTYGRIHSINVETLVPDTSAQALTAKKSTNGFCLFRSLALCNLILVLRI